MAGGVDIGALLARELPAGAVILPGDERLADYGRDESPAGPFPADVAVKCATTDEVAAVLRLCAEHRVPCTPRGAGSGLTGGCLPVRGGVVLSVETMQRVKEISPDDLVAVVEPGVITGELQAAVEAQGLFYPPDPASLEYCSIGGNAANNAGGPRAFRYGVTREYVLGLEVALMGGEVLRVGRRTTKGVTGYDLTAGFVGSEGTFGVITELTLRLLPKPPAVATLLAIFQDVASAARAITALIGRGVRPRVIEIADRTSIDHVRGRSRYTFPANAGAIALIEVDGDADTLDGQIERLGEDCEAAGALDVFAANDPAERRALWEARRLISPSLKEAHAIKIGEDVCVPRGAIIEMLGRVDRIAAEVGLPIAVFGHAGDGNLHVNVVSDEDPADPASWAKVDRACARVFADAVDLRGTLSGEHGIGLIKRPYMHLEQSERVLEWQRRWKAMWDPLDLLNPGKLIPERRPTCSE
ncbi:MAG: FAD-binding protein [Myxococcales bacterium]|nr:FAD-binding protein [Myxococcales bacterium]